MSDYPSNSGQPSKLWGLLWLVPTVIVVPLLVSGLGEFEKGLAPEWLLFEQKGDFDYAELADRLRWWLVATVIVAFLVAGAVYYWTCVTWVSRLKTFNLSRIGSYHQLVWQRAALALVAGLMVAAVAVVLSEPLDEASPLSWFFFSLATGVLAALQFIMFVRGTPRTLRLFRGK